MANRSNRSRKPSRSKTRNGNSSQGEVRIIGGDWRGRKLPVLDAEGLRPTSDRVRETLFNWLQFELAGAKCLDLFAGSGALSFEALSRGADSVTLLELSSDNVRQLKTNLAVLKAANAKLEQADSLQWLNKAADQQFDIVFIDPPFHKGLMQQSVDLLFSQGYINQSSWLYLEQENSLDWPNLPDNWCCHREKSTSQVKFGLFKYCD